MAWRLPTRRQSLLEPIRRVGIERFVVTLYAERVSVNPFRVTIEEQEIRAEAVAVADSVVEVIRHPLVAGHKPDAGRLALGHLQLRPGIGYHHRAHRLLDHRE